MRQRFDGTMVDFVEEDGGKARCVHAIELCSASSSTAAASSLSTLGAAAATAAIVAAPLQGALACALQVPTDDKETLEDIRMGRWRLSSGK